MGSEMDTSSSDKTIARKSSTPINIDGKIANFDIYNIGNSNYFKLRDLQDKLVFDLNYDETTKSIIINTDNTI